MEDRYLGFAAELPPGSTDMARSTRGGARGRKRPLRLSPSRWRFGEVIGQRRIELDLSQQQAADRIGIQRQTLSQAESGSNRMSVSRETVRAIAASYGMDFDYLWSLRNDTRDILTHDGALSQNVSAVLTHGSQSTVENAFPAPPSVQPAGVRHDIPIRQTRRATEGDAMHLSETVVDYAPRSGGIERATGVFAFRMPGESMVPAIREGALLYVDTGRVCRPGDDVLLIIAGDEPLSFVRRLVSISDNSIIVEHFSPERQTTEYLRTAVRDMIHVLTINELMGVS